MLDHKKDVHEVTGTIVLVQADRFRVQTKDGRSLLLVLGKGFRPSIREVEEFLHSGHPVAVRYRGEPDGGGVAVTIKRA
ncbi:MAG: hypothetical protein ACYC1C_16405 [Chloroflexota bacterium]